ncbi:MAG: Uma2 family endonuclease, partial [Epsilonproteobacteria bacterium]
KDGKYIKLCDAYEDSLLFELEKCSFDFDFSKIW